MGGLVTFGVGGLFSLEQALTGQEGVAVRWQMPTLTLAVGKFLATLTTIGSGGSGGPEASVRRVSIPAKWAGQTLIDLDFRKKFNLNVRGAMPDYKQIYQTQAEQYEYLVAHEDYQGNILRALLAIRPLANTTILELGAGTGRLTRLLAPLARQIIACDSAQPMLEVARQKLQQAGWLNWQTVVCDNRAVAVARETADVAIIGWSLGHFISWYADNWRDEIGRCLAEMNRILRPGGTMIILETLGTNQQTPAPPSPGLAVYYQWLEQEQGFYATWIRTDYQYPSAAEAVASIHFFFGEAMADDVARKNSPIVPECTGLWWRRKDKSS